MEVQNKVWMKKVRIYKPALDTQPSQNQAVGGSLIHLLEMFDRLLSKNPHSIFLQMGVTQPTPPNK